MKLSVALKQKKRNAHEESSKKQIKQANPQLHLLYERLAVRIRNMKWREWYGSCYNNRNSPLHTRSIIHMYILD